MSALMDSLLHLYSGGNERVARRRRRQRRRPDSEAEDRGGDRDRREAEAKGAELLVCRGPAAGREDRRRLDEVGLDEVGVGGKRRG